MDYRTFGILLLNEAAQELEMKAGEQYGESVALPKVKVGEGLVGYAAGMGRVGNYLFVIARHFLLMRLRAREAATFDLDEHDERTAWPDERPSVLDSLSREETIQTVRAAIASLPAAYREAVVLCELQEMTYADAAAIAHCPVGTVRSRLHRAKALLMTKLSATRSGGDLVRSATR